MWPGVFYNIKRGKGQKRCGGKGNCSWHFQPPWAIVLRLEYRIKQLTKRQKERLVTGDGSFEALRESLIKSD